jgi:hypothetical protein
MMENMEKIAMKTKKKVMGIEENERLCMGRLEIRSLAMMTTRELC